MTFPSSSVFLFLQGCNVFTAEVFLGLIWVYSYIFWEQCKQECVHDLFLSMCVGDVQKSYCFFQVESIHCHITEIVDCFQKFSGRTAGLSGLSHHYHLTMIYLTSFPICISLISMCYCYNPCFKLYTEKNCNTGQTHLIPDFNRFALCFSPLRMMLAVLSVMYHTQASLCWNMFPPVLLFLGLLT